MMKRLQFERTDQRGDSPRQERRRLLSMHLRTLEMVAEPLDEPARGNLSPDDDEVLAYFRLENPREFRR